MYSVHCAVHNAPCGCLVVPPAAYCSTMSSSALQAVVVNSTFLQNYAGFGGALYKVGLSELNMHTSAFVRNEAATSGGAVFLDNHSRTTVHGCAYTGNHAKYGGGVYCWGCFLITSSTSFTNNNAAEYGGGLYADSAAQVSSITCAEQKGCCIA